MHHTLRLRSSLIAVDSSRFRKTIGKFVVLPWYMPEPNLRDISLICSQHTVVLQLTVKLFDHGGVPHTTLHHRAHGRPSLKDKADSQLYLTPWEESALVKFILQMSDLGQPVRIKYIPTLAFVATHARRLIGRPLKPPVRTGPRPSRNATQKRQRDGLRRWTGTATTTTSPTR
jgi:hypothetical protein